MSTSVVNRPSKPRPRFRKKLQTTRSLKELYLVERIKLDGMLQGLLKEQDAKEQEGNG